MDCKEIIEVMGRDAVDYDMDDIPEQEVMPEEMDIMGDLMEWVAIYEVDEEEVVNVGCDDCLMPSDECSPQVMSFVMASGVEDMPIDKPIAGPSGLCGLKSAQTAAPEEAVSEPRAEIGLELDKSEERGVGAMVECEDTVPTDGPNEDMSSMVKKMNLNV